MKIFKKVSIFITAIILIGCAALRMPVPSQTEYFTSKAAGFTFDKEKKEVNYYLVLALNKKFENTVFAEIKFQNPEDSNDSIVLNETIAPTSEKVAILSPAIYGLKPYRNYKTVTTIYQSPEKKKIITSHTQLVRSMINFSRLPKDWQKNEK